MYLGSFIREVDAKGRFLIPAKLKARLEESHGPGRGAAELVLTLGFDRCLYLFPKKQWAEFIKKEIESRSELSRDTRALKRVIAGNAQEAEIDSQGRLLIPKNFVDEHLRISKSARRIAVVGSMDHIEIWREDAWKNFAREMQQDIDEIAEKISGSGGRPA